LSERKCQIAQEFLEQRLVIWVFPGNGRKGKIADSAALDGSKPAARIAATCGD